ncbi:unnamed protein product, partial [Sphacelaria rigidula]
MFAAENASQGEKRKNLDDPESEEVIRYLLTRSLDGVLKRGAYKNSAVEFGCHWETVKGVWLKYEEDTAAGVIHPNLQSGRKGKSGGKGIGIEALRTRLRDIPLNERTTQFRLAAALGVARTLLRDNLKALGLRTYSNAPH